MVSKKKFVNQPYLPFPMEFFVEETDESVCIFLKSHNEIDSKKLKEKKLNNSLISKVTDELIYLKETKYSMNELQFIHITTKDTENEVIYCSYYQVK